MAVPKDTGATVEYKAWMPVDGGGSETIGITLPTNATPDMMDAAVAQWQNMRDKALPALRAATQVAKAQQESQANLPLAEIKIPFGKYKDCTLGHIYKTDPGYLEWMADKGTDQLWRDRCKQILATPIEAINGTTTETDDDLPF